jgi:CysZ protein
MLKEIIIAVQSYAEAHHFIVKHRLWKWILVTGIVYALLFFASLYFFWITSKGVIEYALSATGLTSWLLQFKESFWGLIIVIIRIGVQLILFFFYFSLFKYIFLIVGSPLFAYLSEKTAAIMEEREYPFSFSQLIKDIGRGIKIALRNCLWQTVYSLSILILSFIPVVGLATIGISFLIECYYLGFSMLDYSCERNKLSTSQSIEFIGKHKGLAIGNGMVFYAMHLVIIIGWILAPTYAVIAATLSLYKSQHHPLP